MHGIRLVAYAALLALLPLTAARADVVVNEIFYNAPDDQDEIQWIELVNTAPQAAELGGWQIDEGKSFQFPAGTRIAGRGYLVVALSPERFRETYRLPALGPLKRPLKRGGERVELRDARGTIVDVARYRDREPWPVSADGYSVPRRRAKLPRTGPPRRCPGPCPGPPAPPASRMRATPRFSLPLSVP
jgi:hypothetical protein